MATGNFHAINAQNIYAVFYDDEWDYKDFIFALHNNDSKVFDNPRDEWDMNMNALEVCCADSNYTIFGNGNAWTLDTMFDKKIVFRSGYYEGANLDYEITLTSSKGDIFNLSDYRGDSDALIEDYMECLEELVQSYGWEHNWNCGTWKLQKKNIRKWIDSQLLKEIELCENFCKENTQETLMTCARFSNGETMYQRV